MKSHPKLLSASSTFSADISRRRFLVAASTFVAGLAAGPLMAAGSRESYAALLKSNPALRGYWRFEGNLVDMLGRGFCLLTPFPKRFELVAQVRLEGATVEYPR